MSLTKRQQSKVLTIAKKHFYGVKERGDLEPRYPDAEDFLDIPYEPDEDEEDEEEDE